MSTTVNYGWLKDKNNNKIAPKTLSSQVITNDGTSLEDKIDGISDGIVVNVPVGNWVSKSNGTYTNTITVNGIDADNVYDMSLYDDYNEDQAYAFDFLLSSIDIYDNQIVLTASEQITVSFSIILRGKVNLENKNVYVSNLNAGTISYDNSESNLDSTNMQNAIDELATSINGLIVTVTTGGWDLQSDGNYKKVIQLDQITGNEVMDVCLCPGDTHTEQQIIAFNELITSIKTEESRLILTATEVITVSFRILLYGKINFDKTNLMVLADADIGAKAISLSQAEYDALSEDEKNNGIYVTPDGEDLTAKNLFYDGSETGLGNNVQDAIDNQNKNTTWKSVGSVTGKSTIKLPSDFNEILIKLKAGSWRYTGVFIPLMLSTTKESYIFGYGVTNQDNYCIVEISLSEASMLNATTGGSDKSDSVVMEFFYR